MTWYIAKERGQIPVDSAVPVKRADSSPNRRVMRIVEAGEQFEFHGKPGKWMERVDPQDDQTGNGRTSRSRATKPQDDQTGQGGSQGKKPQSGESPQDPATQ